jgi:hypothetical protein
MGSGGVKQATRLETVAFRWADDSPNERMF